MTNENIAKVTVELRTVYPKLDDFAANEVVYLVEHAKRLDIPISVIRAAILEAGLMMNACGKEDKNSE